MKKREMLAVLQDKINIVVDARQSTLSAFLLMTLQDHAFFVRRAIFGIIKAVSGFNVDLGSTTVWEYASMSVQDATLLTMSLETASHASTLSNMPSIVQVAASNLS